MAKVSLKQIAQEAGVSISTVSRVAGGEKRFSPETRKRVFDAIEKLGYLPRLSYRNAMKQFRGTLPASGRARTNNIALLCESEWLSDAAKAVYYGEMLQEMALACRDAGFSLLISVLDEKTRLPEPVLDEKVDAVIVRLNADAAFLRRIRAYVPVVLTGFPGQEADVSSVRVNELGAHRTAFKHLTDLGHRRIAYLTSVDAPGSTHERRYRIVLEVMRELGLEVVPAWTRPLPFHPHEPEAAIQSALDAYLNGPEKATAVVTEEFFGFRMCSALRERGVRVPEEFSVVVNGDNLWARYGSEIELTAVRYPMMEMARWAVQEAVSLVEEKDRCVRHLEIDAVLTPRHSSGPAPGVVRAQAPPDGCASHL